MTQGEARQLVTARLAALTPAVGYAQNSTAWVESVVPLVPEFEPEPKSHLSFFVDDRDMSLKPTREGVNGQLLALSLYRLRFLFRLRPNSRITDWDAASDAARAVWRHLLTESGSWNGDLNLSPAEAGFVTRSIVGDAAFCVVTVALVAEYFTEAV